MSSSAVRRPLNPRLPSQNNSSEFRRADFANGRSFKSPRAFRGSPAEPRHRPPPVVPQKKTVALRSSELHRYFASNVDEWASQEPVRMRLVEYGLPSEDVQRAISSFAVYLHSNDVFSELSYSQEQIDTIAEDFSDPDSSLSLDVQLTRLFFEWASSPVGRAALEPQIPENTISKISMLFNTANISQPALYFSQTRCAPRRKFIMHVGPTNSGKTHNALRALAAAQSGVYCGPLRLLAYEIWDRLNKGNIVPLGHDAQTSAKEDTDTNLDATIPGETPAVQKHDNPKFARLCNLITGDDRRIVHEDAGLVSCTVEMLPSKYFDVAVIDEIQLLTDPERGWSWTEAILRVNAPEIHLCGEEAAVPLVERILKDTGDTLEVNRYTRLTPLVLSESSLGGDLSKIEKGDCVVAFSRKQIFELRKDIEAKTGLRCAVVYGRLPPELRNQQALLFNDPDSDFDVLVGSDAIGMGLNLCVVTIYLSQSYPNCAWQKNQTVGVQRHLEMGWKTGSSP
jgi:ATP-dependent RNA helicase SUPV3L1/SUV3